MLTITVDQNRIEFGDDFAVSFQRTLRLPESDKTYPLPPSMGNFPVKRVEDYLDRVPASWREHGGVFIPLYQREALWIQFSGKHNKPSAVKVAVGKVNAVSGKPWNEELSEEEADYMVAPNPQHWLDGINSGDGVVRQFVAMPLGMGYTVEAQVTGEETHGGIQLLVVASKEGKFPDRPVRESLGPVLFMAQGASGGLKSLGPPPGSSYVGGPSSMSSPMRRRGMPAGAEMGIAAGGKMAQKIYPDPHGIDTWDTANYGRLFVHVVNSSLYYEITGEHPPTSPVTAKSYTDAGLPWFQVYDEHAPAIGASDELAAVKPISAMDAKHGFVGQQDDTDVGYPPPVSASKPGEVTDGKW